MSTVTLDSETRRLLRLAISNRKREREGYVGNGDTGQLPLGERLRLLRKTNGLTLRDLAEEGISDAYICHIEKGQRVPSANVLRKLARRLGVTALELETGDPDVPCPHCGRPAANDRQHGL